VERVEHWVVIDRPLSRVYEQWMRFEEFPRFVRGLNDLRPLDDQHLLCHLGVGNDVAVELTFEITEHVPRRLLSWRSVGGWPSAGTVRFESRDEGLYPHTQVRVVLAWDAPRVSFGLIDRRLFEALERFKVFLETRDVATGAWRGGDLETRGASPNGQGPR